MTGPEPADPHRIRIAELAREMLAAVEPCRHGPDFSSVWWYGTYHTFSGTQAHVVKALWSAWLNGTPDVRQETLLSAAETERDRLAHVFRDHPAWGTMIVPGPLKGLFRLTRPG